jgi:RNA recognition motif-containing protein
MKKMILFLAFVLIFSMANNISFSAADDNDAIEVRSVVEEFVKNLSILDTDSAMKLVSANYSDVRDNKTIDYAQFKTGMEKQSSFISKQYVDLSISSLQLNNLSIQGNLATVDIEYSLKGYNLNTLQGEIKKFSRSASLAKEYRDRPSVYQLKFPFLFTSEYPFS